MFGKSDSLGHVSIDLTKYKAGEEHVEEFVLYGGHGKSKATGNVKVALQLSKPVNDLGLVKSGK